MTRRFRLFELLIIFFLIAKGESRKYFRRSTTNVHRSKSVRITYSVSRSSSHSFGNMGFSFIIKRFFGVKKLFNKLSLLFFSNWRLILHVLAKISEMLHWLAFSWEFSDISWSYCKVILPKLFGMAKLSVFIWATRIICLLILHHIDGLSKLFPYMLFYDFRQVTVKDFWWKIHALFFIGISV